MRAWVLAAALILVAGSARAQPVEGHGALALGAIVGSNSPFLSAGQKGVLAQLFAGATVTDAGKVEVAADMIRCRAGNVAINAFACDLTFGAQTIHLTGRAAHELYATLAEIGVPTDGAAGTLYRSISNLRCTIDVNGVSRADGSGADCTYAWDQS